MRVLGVSTVLIFAHISVLLASATGGGGEFKVVIIFNYFLLHAT